MPKQSRLSQRLVVIAAACFAGGVLLTLLLTTSSESNLSTEISPDIFSDASDAFNAVAEALTTAADLPVSSTPELDGSPPRADLLIAIPSSLARSISCRTIVTACMHNSMTHL